MLCAPGEGGNLKRARRIAAAVAAVGTLWLAGCATGPELQPPAFEDYLPPGGQAYFSADVAGNQELVEYVADSLDADVRAVAKRVDFVAGALGAEGVDTVRLAAVATGRFPDGAVRFSLWKNRDFRRHVSEVDGERLITYRQLDSDLEIAVAANGIIVLAAGPVARVLEQSRPAATVPGSGGAAPAGATGRSTALDPATVEAIRAVAGIDGPDVVLVVPDPATFLVSRLNLDLPRFPIIRIELVSHVVPVAAEGRTPDESGSDEPAVRINLAGRFEFGTETEAKLFGRLGRVFILGFVRSLGLDTERLRETVEIETDGTVLVFSGVTMSPAELPGLVGRVTGHNE